MTERGSPDLRHKGREGLQGHQNLESFLGRLRMVSGGKIGNAERQGPYKTVNVQTSCGGDKRVISLREENRPILPRGSQGSTFGDW
jgi:hypothetical protein